MKILELTFSDEVTDDLRQDVSSCLADSKTFEEFILSWLYKEGWSASCYLAVDDENPAEDVLGITLAFYGVKVATVCVDRREALAGYAEARQIASFCRGMRKNRTIDFDTDAFTQWLIESGYKKSYVLQDWVGPKEALFPYLLLFLLCDVGAVRFRAANDPAIHVLVEDMEDELKEEGLQPDRIVTVGADYYMLGSNGRPRAGFFTSMNFQV